MKLQKRWEVPGILLVRIYTFVDTKTFTILVETHLIICLDLFSVIGTVLLWIFWPSFNAVLAKADCYHRAVINTYLSLIGSTVATFVISSFFGK